MDSPKSAVLARAATLMNKTSAAVLWKYVDEDGKDFYLTEKRMGTIKSPYSGKSFTPKAEKSTLSDVGKELKEDGAKAKNALWKYVDGEGREFFLPERLTGTLKSPFDGKSFTPKAEKSTLSDVGKELKDKSGDDSPPEGKTASSDGQMKLASDILHQGELHPALRAISQAYREVLQSVKLASFRKSAGLCGAEEHEPALVLNEIKPAIELLAKTSKVVADQLEQRLKSF